MTNFEKNTGLVNLEELSLESDEIAGTNAGITPTAAVSFITGIISGFISPTGACSSHC